MLRCPAAGASDAIHTWVAGVDLALSGRALGGGIVQVTLPAQRLTLATCMVAARGRERTQQAPCLQCCEACDRQATAQAKHQWGPTPLPGGSGADIPLRLTVVDIAAKDKNLAAIGIDAVAVFVACAHRGASSGWGEDVAGARMEPGGASAHASGRGRSRPGRVHPPPGPLVPPTPVSHDSIAHDPPVQVAVALPREHSVPQEPPAWQRGQQGDVAPRKCLKMRHSIVSASRPLDQSLGQTCCSMSRSQRCEEVGQALPPRSQWVVEFTAVSQPLVLLRSQLPKPARRRR